MQHSSQTSPSSVVNLTFHGLGVPPRRLDAGESDVWLDQDHFFRVLDHVPTDGSVVITFDDGNVSDLQIALPALLARGLSATFFVCAGLIGKPGYLSQDDIGALLRAGMKIGSHGLMHRGWRAMDRSLAVEEIPQAKSILETVTGYPITKAACPFGAYDRVSLRQLRACGFTSIYTSDRGRARRGRWLQPRNTIRRSDPADIVDQLGRLSAADPHQVLRRVRQLAKRAYPLWDDGRPLEFAPLKNTPADAEMRPDASAAGDRGLH